jgi:pimeloyl-ACP methyl ester carboxylesterase
MTGSSVPQRPGTTRFARRGFARLAYETAGDGARAVVLLHDLLGDRSTLTGLRDTLMAAGYRVILPDLRGHGASAAIAGLRLSIADLALDLLAILEAEAIAHVSLVGVGFGAAVALDLAVVEPTRVERLILVDPFVPGLLRDDPDPEVSTAAAEAQAQVAKIADLANKGSLDRALDLFYGARHGPAWRTTLPKARLGAMRRHAAAFGPLLTTGYSYRPTPVKQPTLILLRPELPELDRLGADRLHALILGSELEVRSDQEALSGSVVRFMQAPRDG